MTRVRSPDTPDSLIRVPIIQNKITTNITCHEEKSQVTNTEEKIINNSNVNCACVQLYVCSKSYGNFLGGANNSIYSFHICQLHH